MPEMPKGHSLDTRRRATWERIGKGAGLVGLSVLLLNGWSVQGSCGGANLNNLVTRNAQETLLAITITGDTSVVERIKVFKVVGTNTTQAADVAYLAGTGSTPVVLTQPNRKGAQITVRLFDKCGTELANTTLEDGVQELTVNGQDHGFGGPDRIETSLNVPFGHVLSCASPTPPPVSSATPQPGSTPTPPPAVGPTISAIDTLGKRNYYIPNREAEAQGNFTFKGPGGAEITVASLASSGYTLSWQVRDYASDAILTSGNTAVLAPTFTGSLTSIVPIGTVPSQGIKAYWVVTAVAPGRAPISGSSPSFLLAEPPTQVLSGGRQGGSAPTPVASNT